MRRESEETVHFYMTEHVSSDGLIETADDNPHVFRFEIF